jgi:hypothetical protein
MQFCKQCFFRGSVCMQIIRHLLGKGLLSNFDKCANELGVVTTATHKWLHKAFCNAIWQMSAGEIAVFYCIVWFSVCWKIILQVPLRSGTNSCQWWMGKNVKGRYPVLFYVVISTFCVRGIRTVSKYLVSEGDLNLLTAKRKACVFELLCHNAHLYFGEINFEWPE